MKCLLLVLKQSFVASENQSKHGTGRGRKGGHEGDGNGEEEDVSTSNQAQEKQTDDLSLPSDTTTEHVVGIVDATYPNHSILINYNTIQFLLYCI